jgi:hypothetical protein
VSPRPPEGSEEIGATPLNRPNLIRRTPFAVALAASIGYLAGVAATKYFSQQRLESPSGDSIPITRQWKSDSVSTQRDGGIASDSRDSERSKSKGSLARALAEAEDKRSAGVYVLDSDIEALRERLLASAARAAESRLNSTASEYDMLFAGFELDPATTVQLKQHIEVIFKAQALAQQYTQQLVAARVAYDDRMRELLGTQYEHYRIYEEGKPAERQVSAIQSFAAKSGVNISGGELDLLRGVIDEERLFSTGFLTRLGGPYEDPPAPFGGQWVEPELRARHDSLREGLQRASERAQRTGVSEESIRILEQYYQREMMFILQEIEANRELSGRTGP